ncbi:hypothetical protein CYMTET_15368 [Cymbomonas tetramitiformis]|uniref:Uncharacterized protein n=1 Tax=Cymbomonas tetramitiformis TaxID=36881 RepID=A0AAE0GE62_9CHLO|nr:hypothetical protein CYMTET_15368 [Cymbomonas tetramitiformis]
MYRKGASPTAIFVTVVTGSEGRLAGIHAQARALWLPAVDSDAGSIEHIGLTIFFPALSDNDKLWLWYGTLLLLVVIFIPLFTVYCWHKTGKASDGYERWLKYLAVPLVFECAWRSVFPSLYLQRYAFWDTMLNSIIVDRTFACIGELTWACQYTLVLRHIDTELTGGMRWTQTLAWLSVALAAFGECASYYNTATENELYAPKRSFMQWRCRLVVPLGRAQLKWCAIEIWLWAFSWVCLFPSAVYLFFKCPGKVFGSSAKLYLFILSLAVVGAASYDFLVDGPMYMSRYHADQKAHKKYMKFLEGLEDAAERRVVTRSYADWDEDMTWMLLYFTLAPLTASLMMFAPRVPTSKCIEAKLLQVPLV